MTSTFPASAIGVGCRRGSKTDAIESLVLHAMALVPDLRPTALYTIADKANEPGLVEAARRLALDLIYLSRNTLRGQQAKISIRSSRAQRQFGVPSVAEAAALAGAGPGAVLIVERVARDGITCAIAGHDVRACSTIIATKCSVEQVPNLCLTGQLCRRAGAPLANAVVTRPTTNRGMTRSGADRDIVNSIGGSNPITDHGDATATARDGVTFAIVPYGTPRATNHDGVTHPDPDQQRGSA